MKYIDAGKLKYEIKRRKLSNYYTDTDDYETELFEIIDSLQQEQQDVDLEKEIEAYFKDWSISPYGAFFNEDDYKVSMLEIKDIARYFYELGKNSK
jgi:hypothetical protein